LTPHWERRHLAGVFDSVHAGKMPALPVQCLNFVALGFCVY